MSDIISVSDRVHVAARPLYAGDIHAHFVGETSAINGPLFRAVGYSFVYDPISNTYYRHADMRTRVFSIADPSRDISLLPRKLDINSVQFEVLESGHLLLVDGKGFSMDIDLFRSQS